MKKIISLISAVAVAVACFTPVTFATAKPTMNVTAEKITDFTGAYAGYAEYANDYGLDVYLVTFAGTGLSMTTTTSGMAKKLSGNSIVGASIKFDAVSTALRDDEWVAEQYSAITPPSASNWSGDTYAVAMAGTAPLYPPTKTAATITTADVTPALYQMIFAVDPSQPVTLTFKECAINVGTFASDSMSTSTSYKMIDNTLDISPATLTLPVASSKVDVTSVTISGATSATVGESVTLSADVQPPTATNPTVTWSLVSGDGSVGASTGVVTANSAGDIVVKATADGVDSANYTVTFAAADVIINPVAEEVSAVDSSSPKEFKDLQGKDVTLSKKYGIAKFAPTVNTGTTSYFLDVEDTSGDPVEGKKSFAIDFSELGVEAPGATVNFFAIVRSATHTIKSMVLRAVAK